MKLTVGEVVEVITHYYAQHGDGLTVEEIAELVPCEMSEVKSLFFGTTIPAIEVRTRDFIPVSFEPTKQTLAKFALLGLQGKTSSEIREILGQ